jgi:endonuclease/exonuclease/phosphatase family metal-dependent hydrolase
MKIPRLSGLLALFCGLLAPAFLTAQEAGPEMPVRVLSFNIRFKNTGDKGDRSWDVRKDLAAQVIAEDKPDLIGFQEALRPMLDDLGTAVPGYQEIGVGREDGKTLGEYSCLWIRKDRFAVQDSGTFWLSETPDIPNSMSWGNKITRICTWAKLLDKPSNRVLHFYNVHLDHQSQEARLKGSQQVLKHIQEHAGQGPWVWTGDFNAGEDNAVITGIKASPLKPVDSWRVLHPEVAKEKSGTFHTFTGVQHEAKIDYVFVPEGTKLVDAEIVHLSKGTVFPSDHFPVRATVVFPAR